MVSSGKEHIYMNLQGQGELGAGRRHHAGHRVLREEGYAMAALLVAIVVMGILMSVAMPTWRHQARREKEAELFWRAGQYAHAIELYKRKNPNVYPTSVDVLVKGRYLRKEYLDPMTNDGKGKFRLLSPQELNGTPQLLNLPGQRPRPSGSGGSAFGGSGGSAFGNPPTSGPGGATTGSGFGSNTSGPGTAGSGSGSGFPTSGNSPDGSPTSAPGRELQVGPIAAVASRSTEQSIRIFKGRDHYNQWIVTIDDVVPRQFQRRPGANPNQPNQPQTPNRPTTPNSPSR
jgi:type II secretory pathway pseudopilin PulG